MPHLFRPAQASDAGAICEVLRRSIREVCIADHHGDENQLSQWLENKTPENIAKWVADPDVDTIVCENQGSIIGVGAIGVDGTIHLCYVAPECLGTGAGSGLLHEMLEIARSRSIGTVNLTSTKTARKFYESHGFTYSGKTVLCFGIPGYPMSRKLTGEP